jgi:hypothetical protein
MVCIDNDINWSYIVNAFSNDIIIIAIDSLGKDYQHLRNENTIKSALWKDKAGLHYLGIDHIKTGNSGEKGYSSRITHIHLLLWIRNFPGKSGE